MIDDNFVKMGFAVFLVHEPFKLLRKKVHVSNAIRFCQINSSRNINRKKEKKEIVKEKTIRKREKK